MPFVLDNLCDWCRHAEPGVRACAAFPDGIPDAILERRHDHREPFAGDNGIGFEPRADADPAQIARLLDSMRRQKAAQRRWAEQQP